MLAQYLRRSIAIAVALSAGCGPREPAEPLAPGCFPTNPRQEAVQALLDYTSSGGPVDPAELSVKRGEAGFCEYGGGEWPPAFDGYGSLRPEVIAVCYDVAENERCLACPETDIVAELEAEYADRQERKMCPDDPDSRAIEAFELGCVTRLRSDEDGLQCCYSAVLVGGCDIQPNQSD